MAVAAAAAPNNFLDKLAEAEKRDESRPGSRAGSTASSRASTPNRNTRKPSLAESKSAPPPAKAASSTPSKATPSKKGAAGAPKKDAAATKAIARNVGKEIASFGFKPLGPIAAGAFSTIHKAKHLESGVDVAVKTFFATGDADAEAAAASEERERELQVLRIVSEAMHAHIANLIAEYTSPQGGAVHVCLHYCPGGSLHAHLAKLRKKQMAMNETNAVVCAAQICSAIAHIHKLGVAHRDIKPANVLHDGQRWRLCDFGFSYVCGDDATKAKRECGSLDYLAPEVLGGGGYHGKRVDMWAFGCMVYETRVGRTCFVAPDIESLKLRIKNGFKGGTETNPWLPHMKPPCRKLITLLLSKDPERRLTAEQVLHSKYITEEMAEELEVLKKKHEAGSRLEACLLELEASRQATAGAQAELEAMRGELANAVRRAEEAEAAAAAK